MTLNMKVVSKRTIKGTKIEIIHEAQLKPEELSYSELNNFLKNVEKINKILRAAIKNGGFIEFEIVTYDYNSGESIENYNRWVFNGYPQDDNCELDNGILGYYLRPDLKYTPEHHDMVYDYTLESITT